MSTPNRALALHRALRLSPSLPSLSPASLHFISPPPPHHRLSSFRASHSSLPHAQSTNPNKPMHPQHPERIKMENSTSPAATGKSKKSIKSFEVCDPLGRHMRMEELMDKVTLIVNVDCNVGGSANKECEGLQRVYEQNRHKGLQIVAFPSGQFRVLSKGNETSALQVKEDLEKRYQVTFPVMDKVNVNGENAHPLFSLLQKELGGFVTDAIKWDFTVFLCVDGYPTKRYGPLTSVSTIHKDVTDIFAKMEQQQQQTNILNMTQQSAYNANINSKPKQPPHRGSFSTESSAKSGLQKGADGSGTTTGVDLSNPDTPLGSVPGSTTGSKPGEIPTTGPKI